MNKLKLILISLVAVMGMAMVATPAVVGASAKSEVQQGIKDAGGTGNTKGFGTIAKDIINIMLYVLGAIAVIMIVVGGIRYTTSTGDSSRIKAAKDTIMYSVVGLIVALLAYSIVNFVVTSLG